MIVLSNPAKLPGFSLSSLWSLLFLSLNNFLSPYYFLCSLLNIASIARNKWFVHVHFSFGCYLLFFVAKVVDHGCLNREERKGKGPGIFPMFFFYGERERESINLREQSRIISTTRHIISLPIEQGTKSTLILLI